MNISFFTFGLIDVIAGIILFLNVSVIVKILAIALLTKGSVSMIKAVQH